RDKTRIAVPRRHVMIMETAGHRSFWGAEMFFLFRAALCRRLAFSPFSKLKHSKKRADRRPFVSCPLFLKAKRSGACQHNFSRAISV
ncbi:MAG: hypothetical protein MSH25_05325, partial [Desulfovibrio sp.]|uniref:hypothetical protein n=1 Tax=Desulfovibrio sp. TaxID=885 RepID=UPI0025BF28AC